MADWREYAQRKEWQKIEYLRLSEPEQAELAEMLKQVVPRKVRGHGIEIFEGFIPPREARSREEYEAAWLLERIERRQESNENMATYYQPLAEPLNLAIETLEDCGIDYEGYDETYLYWHAVRRQWVQVSRTRGAAIRAKRETLQFGAPISGTRGAAIRAKRETLQFGEHTDARTIVEWESRYPWRRCQSLRHWFKLRVFELHTPFWHALSILDWYEDFRSAFHEARNIHRIHRFEAIEAVLDAGRSAFEIGRSYEALLKKPFEPHALRGFGILQDALSGAEARRGKLEPKTRKVLAAMEPLVPKHGVSNAARLVADRGVGTSAGANRTLWYRHRTKKL